jgi:hypothetical protein
MLRRTLMKALAGVGLFSVAKPAEAALTQDMTRVDLERLHSSLTEHIMIGISGGLRERGTGLRLRGNITGSWDGDVRLARQIADQILSRHEVVAELKQWR